MVVTFLMSQSDTKGMSTTGVRKESDWVKGRKMHVDLYVESGVSDHTPCPTMKPLYNLTRAVTARCSG